MKPGESEKLFQQFVDIIHFGEKVYDWNPSEHDHDDPPRQPLTDYAGWMYVTTGDDVPWLAIYGPDNFGIALKPALALYWLQKIQEYYHSSNQTARNE